MDVKRAPLAAGSDGNKAQHNAQEGMVSVLSAAEMAEDAAGEKMPWAAESLPGHPPPPD